MDVMKAVVKVGGWVGGVGYLEATYVKVAIIVDVGGAILLKK